MQLKLKVERGEDKERLSVKNYDVQNKMIMFVPYHNIIIYYVEIIWKLVYVYYVCNSIA